LSKNSTKVDLNSTEPNTENKLRNYKM